MTRGKAASNPSTWTCTPCGKVGYSTRKLARAAARRSFPADRMRAYPCPHADGYHFGHVPRRQVERGTLIIPDRRLR